LLQGFTDVDSSTLWVDWLSTDQTEYVSDDQVGRTFGLKANYNGPLTLHYTVTDGSTRSEEATLVVNVAAVNDAPAFTDWWLVSELHSPEDTAYVVTQDQLLQGYTDVEGDTLSVTDLEIGDNGRLDDNGDGTWTITPDHNNIGAQQLSYGVTDRPLTTAVTRSVYFDSVDDAPVLIGAQAVLPDAIEDTPYTVTQEQLRQGFTDVADGEVAPWTYSLSVEHASVEWDSINTWTIRPDNNYNGQLTLKYIVGGAPGWDAPVHTLAELSLNVLAVNDAPALTDAPATLAEGIQDTAYTVPVSQLLQGYSDADYDDLFVANLTSDHGLAVDNGDGTWTVTPESGYSGTLLLDYDVSDGTALTHVQASTQLNLFMG
jgi:hypothetical protein